MLDKTCLGFLCLVKFIPVTGFLSKQKHNLGIYTGAQRSRHWGGGHSPPPHLLEKEEKLVLKMKLFPSLSDLFIPMDSLVFKAKYGQFY